MDIKDFKPGVKFIPQEINSWCSLAENIRVRLGLDILNSPMLSNLKGKVCEVVRVVTDGSYTTLVGKYENELYAFSGNLYTNTYLLVEEQDDLYSNEDTSFKVEGILPQIVDNTDEKLLLL